MANNTAGGCGCLVVLFIIAGIGVASCGHNSDKTASDTTTTSAPAGASIEIGDEGYLDDGSNNVLVARTQEASGKITDAAIAKDIVGMHQLVNSGDAFFADKGTKVKLIGYADGIMGATTYHIRFENGPRTDEDGWIAREWMKK